MVYRIKRVRFRSELICSTAYKVELSSKKSPTLDTLTQGDAISRCIVPLHHIKDDCHMDNIADEVLSKQSLRLPGGHKSKLCRLKEVEADKVDILYFLLIERVSSFIAMVHTPSSPGG